MISESEAKVAEGFFLVSFVFVFGFYDAMAYMIRCVFVPETNAEGKTYYIKHQCPLNNIK